MHPAASARHQRVIPNQHASCRTCDTMHMLFSSKIKRKNREKPASRSAKMHFATETSLVGVGIDAVDAQRADNANRKLDRADHVLDVGTVALRGVQRCRVGNRLAVLKRD